MIKVSDRKIIDVSDWDNLVQETYGKPYSFQQQDDCQDRGIVNITIPSDYDTEGEMHDNIPEEVNGEQMGMKFDVWLARDPEKPLSTDPDRAEWMTKMWWERNFYPNLHTVANDLYNKGLIEAGNYAIDINW